jgi:hypothetical protein
MSKRIPKLVTSTHYHVWTDALHARELARQAQNKWDRGTYVRWTVNTAWTALEIACEDALGVTGIGRRFKMNLVAAVAANSLPQLDWGSGVWQQVLKVHSRRKSYVHINVPQNDLFPDVSEAEEAICILRDAIKTIYSHAGKQPPAWVEDDADRGWPEEDRVFGVLSLGLPPGVDENDPGVTKITFFMKGREWEWAELPPGEDPEPHIQELITNARSPICWVRIYRAKQLIEERSLPMRGT